MRYYASTIRNGYRLCGNVGHINNVWKNVPTFGHMLRKLKEVIDQRYIDVRHGDIIVIERADEDRPYHATEVCRLVYNVHTGELTDAKK